MFRLETRLAFVQLPPESISALYQSVNNASVLLPGVPSAQAQAVVIGYRLEPRLFGVMIALHLIDVGRHLIYVHDGDGLDAEGARQAAVDAIAFAESMGFFMENGGWKDLDPVAQRERLASLKVFQPAEPVAEAPKQVDPRTKLARLLVQF